MAMRDALLALTLRANAMEMGKTVRRFALGTASLLRGNKEQAEKTLSGIAEVSAIADAEAAEWITGAPLTPGAKFNACDLRVWLALAKEAKVPAVPAREILTLNEDEVGALTGSVAVPDFIRKGIAKGAARFMDTNVTPEPAAAMDTEALYDRLFDAMDEVPHGWMVRSHICGPSTLKTFAGAGVITSGEDSVKAGPTLEVGPGWVRQGNRRRIDATDHRFVSLFAQGNGNHITYMARPWMEAARRFDGDDPHRHGTMFAGKGSWPYEWRVFVRNGKVTGVAAYYGWASEATPENARKALEAAALAQQIVDAGLRLDLKPRMMDLVLSALGNAPKHPTVQKALDLYGEGFSCTLDFLETAEGMMFLEGGPAHTPIGGGHPCAFAGVGATTSSAYADTTGVALKLMPHVTLADPKTWKEGDRTGCVLTWEEASLLATS